MQHFNLIFDECKKVNELLENTFNNDELFFIDANISEITYGLDKNAIVFCYYPERYEYGKIMLLKGVFLRMSYDKERQYSVYELNSFFQNDCKFYEETNQFRTREEYVNLIKSVLHQLNLSQIGWEEKFVQYKKSITPEW